MEKKSPQCVKCNVLRCGTIDRDGNVPSSCPTEMYPDVIQETKEKYLLPENKSILQGWLQLMTKILDPKKTER